MTNQLERIQNSALRTIFKANLSDRISSEKLRKKAKIEPIKNRQEKLLKKYLIKAKINQNDLIDELINSFKAQHTQLSIKHPKSSKFKTILCSTVRLWRFIKLNFLLIFSAMFISSTSLIKNIFFSIISFDTFLSKQFN